MCLPCYDAQILHGRPSEEAKDGPSTSWMMLAPEVRPLMGSYKAVMPAPPKMRFSTGSMPVPILLGTTPPDR